MSAKKPFVIAAVSALVGAFIPTLIVLQMMADNNNNGEVYDTVTGKLDLGYVLSVSATYYVPSFLVIFAAVFGVARLWNVRTDDFDAQA